MNFPEIKNIKWFFGGAVCTIVGTYLYNQQQNSNNKESLLENIEINRVNNENED